MTECTFGLMLEVYDGCDKMKAIMKYCTCNMEQDFFTALFTLGDLRGNWQCIVLSV